MADDTAKKHADDTKKKLAEERDARSKSLKEAAAVKPTPTQEENDLAASGVHVEEHEPDGSPQEGGADTKNKEAKPAAPKAGYQTRASTV